MQMPGRVFKQTGKDYRYSINGQEIDKELNENITTALYWEYDSRIGRRGNVDPKSTIGVSYYSTFLNNPILNKDAFGDSVPPKLDMKAQVLANNRDFAKSIPSGVPGAGESALLMSLTIQRKNLSLILLIALFLRKN